MLPNLNRMLSRSSAVAVRSNVPSRTVYPVMKVDTNMTLQTGLVIMCFLASAIWIVGAIAVCIVAWRRMPKGRGLP